jgi:hypothetical protein
MELQELVQDWSATKGALLEGLSERQKKITAPVLDNTKKHLMETAPAGATSAGAIGNFQNIVIPMIRRIIPGTIASELVGVQPMTGPVGLAYSLRFQFSQSLNTNGVADITAGDEVFGNNSKTKRFYSGAATVGVDGVAGTADDVATGFGADTADFESFGGRQLQLTVLKQTVTAQSRKLQAKWTIEAMQDLSAQHGLDLESEITAALSAEVVQDIDNEIIWDLIGLAGTTETFDMNSSNFTGVPNYVGDRHAVLGVLINKVANEIARKTRKGPGNFIVVSPLVASVLQSASKSVFAPAVAGSFEGPNNTKLIGTLNGSIKVYTYLYHDTGAEPILVGYKGGNGETDAGYFYCPYIPLMSSGVITDPNTYNPQISLMTRYGKATFTNTATSLGNGADYYRQDQCFKPVVHVRVLNTDLNVEMKILKKKAASAAFFVFCFKLLSTFEVLHCRSHRILLVLLECQSRFVLRS